MRPMSEAPRDGTTVLAWFRPVCTVAIVFWDADECQWVEPNDGPCYEESDLAGWIQHPGNLSEFEAMGRALKEVRGE